MAFKWTKKQLDGFEQAAQSLKQYRRAELQKEDGTSLIEKLYVDPLPHEHILQVIMQPHTTFLIGRKGTGKSTIIARAQHELRKRKNYASAYIDIKTLFESSKADPNLIAKTASVSEALPKESFEKLQLYKAFMRTLIHGINEELKKRITSTMLERIKSLFSGSIEELFEGLDMLLDDIDNNQYSSIAGLKLPTIHSKNETSVEADAESSVSASLWPTLDLKASITAKDLEKVGSESEQTFADVLMLTFNIKDFILRLKILLNNIKVKHLYIFIDDFSELPQDAMAIVVDTLLAPLNNWSEELIKFKIAAYPGMVYYGNIDKTKIDEINLDLYRLYGASEVTSMEEKAVEFTRRLIESRLQHFCNCDVNTFIDPKNEDIWRVFFYATMANPRILGHILFYLYQSAIIYNKPITSSLLGEAARKYYEEKIEAYFKINKFLQVSFSERSSVMSLKELLEAIVKNARKLRVYRNSQIMRDITGRPPTSHFYVLSEFETLLSTLELNFFLTKYYERSDRDGRKVSVFALNYGLCQKLFIEFGRPYGKPGYSHYYTERIFDYTPILQHYLKVNQEIICENCKSSFSFSDLYALQKFRMKCPNCFAGTCQIINLSKKYESILLSVDKELLLPPTELGILQTLKAEKHPMIASAIAEELDCSYQLIGKRGKILADRGLVDRIEIKQGRRQFQLTKTAEEQYFSNNENKSDGLDVDNSD